MAMCGWATSLHEIAALAPGEAVEHTHRDRPDVVLVIGDPARGEPALEEGLEPIVLRRVHRDEHPLLELEREDRVREGGDAPIPEE